MARSQRHKKQQMGKVSRDRQDAKGKIGTYSGSNMRASATAGSNTHSRAGSATAEDGANGAGYRVGGYAGTSTKGTALNTVSGGIADPITPSSGLGRPTP